MLLRPPNSPNHSDLLEPPRVGHQPGQKWGLPAAVLDSLFRYGSISVRLMCSDSPKRSNFTRTQHAGKFFSGGEVTHLRIWTHLSPLLSFYDVTFLLDVITCVLILKHPPSIPYSFPLIQLWERQFLLGGK